MGRIIHTDTLMDDHTVIIVATIMEEAGIKATDTAIMGVAIMDVEVMDEEITDVEVMEVATTEMEVTGREAMDEEIDSKRMTQLG